MNEDIEEEVNTADFYSPSAPLLGGKGISDASIDASRSAEASKNDLSALNDTFATLGLSNTATADKTKNDFSILWGSLESPSAIKQSGSGETDSFCRTFSDETDSNPSATKAGSDLNLTGFLEEPFRCGGDESSEDDDKEEADDVSPAFTPFVGKVNANGGEASSTNDDSMSMATPTVQLGRHFDTALSMSGKPKGIAVGRMPSSAALSSSSSYGSARPPPARLSGGSRASSSGSRVSSVGSVQSSEASQTISLMTPIDRNIVAGYSATATKEDIKPLLGDLESPMSGASELLLPSPSPARNQSVAFSLSSASQSRASTVGADEEDASAFIETVVSELIEEDQKEVDSDVEEFVSCRSTLTHSAVSANQRPANPHAAIIEKEDADAAKAQMVVTTAGESFALVPSTYEFTPKDQRQPALTKEAMQNASFLFSPNNMGRAALKQQIAEKRANRKSRSALERYTVGLRTSTGQARIGYSRDSFPLSIGNAGSAISEGSNASPATSSVSSIGTASVSKPSSSFRVSPESTGSVATPAPHDEDAASARVESTPQPVVSPSESAQSFSSQPTQSMVRESAVTPWKTESPFARFTDAKKIFSGRVGPGEKIESLVSSDEMDEKVSEASVPSADSDAASENDAADVDVPEDELKSFVTAIASEAASPEVENVVGSDAETAQEPTKPSEQARPAVPKPFMASSTSHAGRLRKNRLISSKNVRRDTAGAGVLAPHRSNLQNPLFAAQPVINEDEETIFSENTASILPSVRQVEVGGDEEQSTISSILSMAKECVALSSASAVGSVAATQEDGGNDNEDDEAEDDFSLALKSTTSVVAASKDEKRLSTENKQRSIRWSESTRATDAWKKPSWAGANASRSIVLADSFDEESMLSSQYTADKENFGNTSTAAPLHPQFAQNRKGLVDPRTMSGGKPPAGTAALCLSPSFRTPVESRKWRELANSSNSKKNSSAKKFKERLSSSKRRLSSGKKKKKPAAGKRTPLKMVATGKHTPIKAYDWESKHY